MDSSVKCALSGLVLRLVIIAYGEWHDERFHVPFTDVDYKVFSDAARHVAEGNSPYDRHTYRYSPVLAWLLLPNAVLASWGKILFSCLDVFISLLYVRLAKVQGFSNVAALRCGQAWLFNPLTVIISTRGNSDSLNCLSVLLAAYYVLEHKPVLAGTFLALSVHMRLYPVVFGLPMYLALGSGDSSVKKLWPNGSQMRFVLAAGVVLVLTTCLCYHLYGYEYLHESIIYHLRRKDTRHNFSVYFYLLYLEPEQSGALLFLPQLLLLLLLSISYSNKSDLLFAMFACAFTVVAYNPVCTSQYFLWHLSLLVPCLPRLASALTALGAARLAGMWLLAQLAWLVPAYLLEFRGKDTFLFVWLQGIGFFCANVAVLVKLLRSYDSIDSRKVVQPKKNS